MADEHLRTNRIMRNTLPDNIFIDVSNMLCNGEPFCPIFTEQGD